MENFIEKYNVSRETFLKLKTYESLLVEWQGKFNLVSNSTLDCLWKRHFLDSAQLVKYIPANAEKLFDFGSGAGFPGMVVAVMQSEKMPYLKVSLVESTGKKTMFLNCIKETLGLTNVEVLNCRVESISKQKADVITSRAMTALNSLLDYAYPFCTAKTVCIFPKGKKYAEEIAEAKKSWQFDCQIHDSEQSSEGKILVITNLSKVKRGK